VDGAAVTIFSNGAAAAEGLGVPVAGLGGRVETLAFGTPDGRPFATADLRELERRTGHGVATIPRRAILERFAGALPAGAVAFRSEVTDVEVGPAQVRVGDHTADVLVGADGYRSVVRGSVLGDEPAARNGWISWQGLTKDIDDLGTHAVCMVGPAGLCGLMPAGDGLLQWWFDVEAAAPEHPLAWLRSRFHGYADPVPHLLDRLTDADVQEYPHVTHRIPDRWGTGPTTLLGDAAHAFPPSQAQGANQALEDAWLLRRALAGDVPRLRDYERIRARRVRRIARLAASEVTNRSPSSAARLAGRLLSPRGLARLQLATIRRASSVLNDDRFRP
jgi:FAD-dependent urate hydroxylase